MSLGEVMRQRTPIGYERTGTGERPTNESRRSVGKSTPAKSARWRDPQKRPFISMKKNLSVAGVPAGLYHRDAFPTEASSFRGASSRIGERYQLSRKDEAPPVCDTSWRRRCMNSATTVLEIEAGVAIQEERARANEPAGDVDAEKRQASLA
jgi:hypothetical protein